jgi:hypothetical protein
MNFDKYGNLFIIKKIKQIYSSKKILDIRSSNRESKVKCGPLSLF